MRHFRSHPTAFTQCWVRVSRLANIQSICTHLNGQRNLADHVARSMRADHAATENLHATMGFEAIIE